MMQKMMPTQMVFVAMWMLVRTIRYLTLIAMRCAVKTVALLTRTTTWIPMASVRIMVAMIKTPTIVLTLQSMKINVPMMLTLVRFVAVLASHRAKTTVHWTLRTMSIQISFVETLIRAHTMVRMTPIPMRFVQTMMCVSMTL
jgi:hypothetical protein